ncbi:MAG: hypothetical protein LH624_16330 [Cryobacterium sp.]|nr:hypothetical protein [Cryobacterium sp.]
MKSIDDIGAALSNRNIWKMCPGDWDGYAAASCPVDLLGPIKDAEVNNTLRKSGSTSPATGYGSTPPMTSFAAWGHPSTSSACLTCSTAAGPEEGRITWLRRGWPDLIEELAACQPRLRELV